MKKQSMKKSLVLILSILMIFALCPIALFADDVVEDEISMEQYDAMVAEYFELYGEYEAKVSDFENLALEFEAAKEAYEALAEAYQEDPENVSYDDVEAAYAEAEALLEEMDGLKAEIDGLLEELEAKAAELEAYFNDILAGYDLAMVEFKQDLKGYAKDLAAFLKDEARKLVEHAKEVREYNEWLKEHPNYDEEKEAYVEALEQWEADMAAYEAFQDQMKFTKESSLLIINGEGVPAYLPGNNSANGGKKINPNDGEIVLAPGLSVIADRGSDQWNFIVTGEALDKEFVIWLHGNTNGEYVLVTFPAEGKYPVGNENGMNHIRLVGSMEKPVAPTDPGEKKLDPGCYTPGDFDGLRPDMPGKPQPTTLPDGTPVLVTLGLDGKIDKIEIDPGKPPVFENDDDDDDKTPVDPDPIPPSEPDEPTTTEILDDPAPLAGIMDIGLPEEEFVIMDEDAPLGNLPQTGSTANAAMGAAGLIAAVFSLAGAGATLSKKEED